MCWSCWRHFEIRDGYIFINGTRTVLPERAKPQYNFFINTEGKSINQASLVNRYGAREGLKYRNSDYAITKNGGYILTLTDNEAKKIAKNPNVKSVVKMFEIPKGMYGNVFPYIPLIRMEYL